MTTQFDEPQIQQPMHQPICASGIYKILNAINGKCYIGSAVHIQKRWNSHKSKLARGIHHSIHLQRSYDKHGADAFEFSVIEYVDDVTQLIAHEQKWIDSESPALNISRTAGSPLGVKHTPETRAKMSASRTGIKHSPEHIAKRVAKIVGQKHPPRSAEWREKQSIAQSGKKKSDESKAKVSATLKGRSGRKFTDADKEKMSAIKTGLKASEETKSKMSASRKAYCAKKRELKLLEGAA